MITICLFFLFSFSLSSVYTTIGHLCQKVHLFIQHTVQPTGSEHTNGRVCLKYDTRHLLVCRATVVICIQRVRIFHSDTLCELMSLNISISYKCVDNIWVQPPLCHTFSYFHQTTRPGLLHGKKLKKSKNIHLFCVLTFFEPSIVEKNSEAIAYSLLSRI